MPGVPMTPQGPMAPELRDRLPVSDSLSAYLADSYAAAGQAGNFYGEDPEVFMEGLEEAEAYLEGGQEGWEEAGAEEEAHEPSPMQHQQQQQQQEQEQEQEQLQVHEQYHQQQEQEQAPLRHTANPQAMTLRHLAVLNAARKRLQSSTSLDSRTTEQAPPLTATAPSGSPHPPFTASAPSGFATYTPAPPPPSSRAEQAHTSGAPGSERGHEEELEREGSGVPDGSSGLGERAYISMGSPDTWLDASCTIPAEDVAADMNAPEPWAVADFSNDEGWNEDSATCPGGHSPSFGAAPGAGSRAGAGAGAGPNVLTLVPTESASSSTFQSPSSLPSPGASSQTSSSPSSPSSHSLKSHPSSNPSLNAASGAALLSSLSGGAVPEGQRSQHLRPPPVPKAGKGKSGGGGLGVGRTQSGKVVHSRGEDTAGTPLARATSVAVPGAGGAGVGVGVGKREKSPIYGRLGRARSQSITGFEGTCDGPEGEQQRGEGEQGAWGLAQEHAGGAPAYPSAEGKARGRIPKSRSESAGAQGRRSRGGAGEGEALYDVPDDSSGEPSPRELAMWRAEIGPEDRLAMERESSGRFPYNQYSASGGNSPAARFAQGGRAAHAQMQRPHTQGSGRAPLNANGTASTSSSASFSPHHRLALAPFGPIELAGAEGSPSPSPRNTAYPRSPYPRSSSAGRAVLRGRPEEGEAPAPRPRARTPGRSKGSGSGSSPQQAQNGASHNGGGGGVRAKVALGEEAVGLAGPQGPGAGGDRGAAKPAERVAYRSIEEGSVGGRRERRAGGGGGGLERVGSGRVPRRTAGGRKVGIARTASSGGPTAEGGSREGRSPSPSQPRHSLDLGDDELRVLLRPSTALLGGAGSGSGSGGGGGGRGKDGEREEGKGAGTGSHRNAKARGGSLNVDADLDWDAHLGDPGLGPEGSLEQGWDPDSFLLAYGVPMGDQSARAVRVAAQEAASRNRRAASFGGHEDTQRPGKGKGKGSGGRGTSPGTSSPVPRRNSRGAAASGQDPLPQQQEQHQEQHQQEGYTEGDEGPSQGPVIGSFKYGVPHAANVTAAGAAGGLGLAHKAPLRALDLSEPQTGPSHSHSHNHSHSHSLSHSQSDSHSDKVQPRGAKVGPGFTQMVVTQDLDAESIADSSDGEVGVRARKGGKAGRGGAGGRGLGDRLLSRGKSTAPFGPKGGPKALGGAAGGGGVGAGGGGVGAGEGAGAGKGERAPFVSVGAAPFVGVAIGEVGRSGLNEGGTAGGSGKGEGVKRRVLGLLGGKGGGGDEEEEEDAVSALIKGPYIDALMLDPGRKITCSNPFLLPFKVSAEKKKLMGEVKASMENPL